MVDLLRRSRTIRHAAVTTERGERVGGWRCVMRKPEMEKESERDAGIRNGEGFGGG